MGIENVPREQMEKTVIQKYLIDLTAPYTKLVSMSLSRKWFDFTELGLWMYHGPVGGRVTSEVIRKVSTGKAVGLDPITDKWLKKPFNMMMMSYELQKIMSGWITPTPIVNKCRMFLLSKEDTPIPPINRIRPI